MKSCLQESDTVVFTLDIAAIMNRSRLILVLHVPTLFADSFISAHITRKMTAVLCSMFLAMSGNS